jgi:hypothetical protein
MALLLGFYSCFDNFSQEKNNTPPIAGPTIVMPCKLMILYILITFHFEVLLKILLNEIDPALFHRIGLYRLLLPLKSPDSQGQPIGATARGGHH